MAFKTMKGAGSVMAIAAMSFSMSSLAADDESFDAEEFFKKGMQERTEGKPYSAIESFQSILSNQPSLQRARLELAVAYLQTLQFEEAEAEAQKVLDDPNTPDNVRISILAFLAQVKSDSDSLLPGHTTKFTASAGLLYDTNVNVGPSNDVVNIRGTDFQLDSSSQPIEDLAYVLSLGVDHSYRTDKRMQVGESTGLLLWQSGAALYNRTHESEHDFDLGVISLRTGPAVVTNGSFRGSLPVVFDTIFLGDDLLAHYIGVQPSMTWSLEDNVELTTTLEATQRNFQQSADEDRDADYYAIGMSLGKGYRNNTVAVQGGIRLFRNDAEIGRYTYSGSEIFVGANWQFKPQALTFARISETRSDYDGNEPVFNIERDEKERQMQLGLIYEFENELSLNGTVSYTKNKSNVDTFDYDRYQYNVSVTKSY